MFVDVSNVAIKCGLSSQQATSMHLERFSDNRRARKMIVTKLAAAVFICAARFAFSMKVSVPRTAARVIGSIGCSLGLFTSIPSFSNAAISDPTSIARFRQGYQDLQELDKNWDSVVKDSGDNVRRVLGTVYSNPCSVSLCNFPTFVNKFAKANVDELDLSAFDGPSLELLEALNQADFLAYSSVFSGYGNGGGGEDYIGGSRKQVQRGINAFKEVLDVLEAK